MIRNMKPFGLLLAIFGLILPAHSEDRQPFTVEQAIQIGNGLSQLDGYDDCRDGEKGKDCHHLYKLSGSVRLTIALDLAEYRRIATAYTAARQGLIAQYANGSGVVPPEQVGAFNAEDRRILNLTSDVKYGRIKLSNLRVEENPIPATVLSLIVPILD